MRTAHSVSPASIWGDWACAQHRLDELAAVAGIGKFRLIRLFREQKGLPPAARPSDRPPRPNRAPPARGRHPIAEAAAATGFADQSHFHRQFQRSLGLTPGEYRGASAPPTPHPGTAMAMATLRRSAGTSARSPESIRCRRRTSATRRRSLAVVAQRADETLQKSSGERSGVVRSNVHVRPSNVMYIPSGDATRIEVVLGESAIVGQR